jgi:hypothetical protein
VVALAITAPISRLKGCSLSYFHVTKRAAAKRTNEKIPMLGLAQSGSRGGGGIGVVEVGVVVGVGVGVGVEDVSDIRASLLLADELFNRSMFWPVCQRITLSTTPQLTMCKNQRRQEPGNAP